jgi:hypothetical protein
LLGALLGTALMAGCGGSSSSSATGSAATGSSSSTPTTSTVAETRVRGEQPTAPALASCKRAVAQEATVAAAAKPEISALCDRINDVVEDNESTVQAVCQELANASSVSSGAARKRIDSTCYAEYAKTIK